MTGGYITTYWTAIRGVVSDTLAENNENEDDYIVHVYPIKLERLDKKPISKHLLRDIREKLGT